LGSAGEKTRAGLLHPAGLTDSPKFQPYPVEFECLSSHFQQTGALTLLTR
jgi:hypothetical protein